MPADANVPDDFSFEAAWKTLNENQRRYVLNRHKHKSKKETAEALGIPKGTAYGYPDKVDWCVQAMIEDQLDAVRSQLRELAIEAAGELPGLVSDAEDESTKLRAIQYVLDQTLGKAKETQQVDMNAKVEGININITDEGEEPEVE